MGFTIDPIISGDGINFPQRGDRVTFHYVCFLQDGSRVDSSWDRPGEFQIEIGVGKIVRGLDEAILQFSLGQKATTMMTHDYAYGAPGFPPVIPPYSVLRFDVELVKIIPYTGGPALVASNSAARARSCGCNGWGYSSHATGIGTEPAHCDDGAELDSEFTKFVDFDGAANGAAPPDKQSNSKAATAASGQDSATPAGIGQGVEEKSVDLGQVAKLSPAGPTAASSGVSASPRAI